MLHLHLLVLVYHSYTYMFQAMFIFYSLIASFIFMILYIVLVKSRDNTKLTDKFHTKRLNTSKTFPSVKYNHNNIYITIYYLLINEYKLVAAYIAITIYLYIIYILALKNKITIKLVGWVTPSLVGDTKIVPMYA